MEPIEKDGEVTGYRAEITLDKATYEEWFDGSFTNGGATAKGALIITPEKVIVTTPGADNKKEL